MIYPFLRVQLPDVSGYTIHRNGIDYFFAYVGERVKLPNGKTRHPRAKMLGRIEAQQDGSKLLIPNSAYYELMKLPLPAVAVAEGPGRKPVEHKNVEPIQKPEGAQMSLGYGYVSFLLLNELNIISILKECFGDEQGYEIQALATYLCDGPHSSLSNLRDFVDDNLCLNVSSSFDRRRAGELLAKLSSEDRCKFFSEWNKCLSAKSKQVFYDVTSFSTYSGQIMKASYGYNRDGEDLPQVNIGLFCDRETGLPLDLCSYDGSLNDAQNFKYALRNAKAHNMHLKDNRMIIVMDGGFSQDCFNWAHLEGYNFIAGVSALRYKEVKKQYIAWSRTLTTDELANSWRINDDLYVSKRIPFILGGVDGFLVMYRDLRSQSAKQQSLIKLREKKEQELIECTEFKGKDFDSWAKSFEPFFKVEKAKGRKGFTYTKDLEQQSERFALCGKVTLFTTCDKLSDKELMEAYRSKESVEDCFDTTKNGLCDHRLHVQGDAQVDGKLFVTFIGLILRRTIHNRVKDYEKKYNVTDSDVIAELKKILFVKQGKYWRLKDAITKKQKELLGALQLKTTEKDFEQAENQQLHHKKVRKQAL